MDAIFLQQIVGQVGSGIGEDLKRRMIFLL